LSLPLFYYNNFSKFSGKKAINVKTSNIFEEKKQKKAMPKQNYVNT
jgi:hypothetical protein